MLEMKINGCKNRNKSKFYLTNAFFISLRHGYFSVACNAVNAKLAAHSKAPFALALSICQQAFPAYLMQDILKLNIYFCKACPSLRLYILFIYPEK